LQKHVAAKRKPSTLAGYERLLRLHVLPALGAMRVTEIRRAHVTAMHWSIAPKGAANRAASLASAILNFAAREYEGLDLPPNPARNIVRNPERGRQRFLSMDELGRLGQALRLAETIGLTWAPDLAKPGAKHAPRPKNRVRIIDPFAVAAIRLLLLTGARLHEILDARWEWLDTDLGFLALPDSKTGRKTLFLNDAARGILA
jgi:integrase